MTNLTFSLRDSSSQDFYPWLAGPTSGIGLLVGSAGAASLHENQGQGGMDSGHAVRHDLPEEALNLRDMMAHMPSSVAIDVRHLIETLEMVMAKQELERHRDGISAGMDISIIQGIIKRRELKDALSDLESVRGEADEEGFPQPSDMAITNAQRVLGEMYAFFPCRYEIYPTPDGEVAIDASGGYGRSVLLLCDSEGGALCLVDTNGKDRRARYSDADVLPDGFLREALAELSKQEA